MRLRHLHVTDLCSVLSVLVGLGSLPRPTTAQADPPPPGRPCTFVAEIVHLKIERGVMTGTATYSFAQFRQDDYCPIVLPFLSDATMGDPEFMSATISCCAEVACSLAVHRSLSRWSWNIPPTQCDTCAVTIMWRQSLRTERAGYLITTARAWHHPLRSARFEVDIPSDLGQPIFTYPFVVERKGEESTLYSWTAADFDPDRELIITWTKP